MNTAAQILIPVGILGAMALVFGLLLAVASKIFEVKVDERVPLVRDALPGANCGGCGFPGCDACAAAIVGGTAACNACPVGGAAAAEEIAKIMGEEAIEGPRLAAMVLCQGDCEVAPRRADYYGVMDCREAVNANGGAKDCRFGCIGYGSCVKACKFDALHMSDKMLPVVNRDNCTACNQCVIACPKGVMQLVPYDHDIRVNCKNMMKGKFTRTDCSKGCIACRRCVKVCPTGAVTVADNLASIDYEKCIQCGLCVEVCPTHALTGNKKEGALEAYEKAHPEYKRPEAKPKKAPAKKPAKAEA